MLELIPKIIGYMIARKTGLINPLPMNYTISLLYTCNSRCSTCNIYDKKADNLTLSEYDEIFRHLGRSPYWITFSGGEPFLRKDIDDICISVYKHCHPAIINIPTNGILTELTIEKVKKIVDACPETQFVINLSIDGVGEQHDNIRNVPGNYEKVTATLKGLKKLQRKNLSLGIHTVISKLNVEEFPLIATELMGLEPDSYITEIAEAREELDTMKADITPEPLAYTTAIDYLIHRIKNGKYAGIAKITEAFRIEYYNLVKHILRDKTQVIPCYSGIASAQISPDGDVWSCCIKARSLGNLRENDYDFRRIWNNHNFKLERKSIKKKECWCPLANAGYTNMLMNPGILFRVFQRSYIKWYVSGNRK
ncbi:MAG: radical SAM protein [Candidatus Cloacimonetes bacterium]|nr:radical SAM protein [Candidatus Cloacimonadota bacterium]